MLKKDQQADSTPQKGYVHLICYHLNTMEFTKSSYALIAILYITHAVKSRQKHNLFISHSNYQI